MGNQSSQLPRPRPQQLNIA